MQCLSSKCMVTLQFRHFCHQLLVSLVAITSCASLSPTPWWTIIYLLTYPGFPPHLPHPTSPLTTLFQHTAVLDTPAIIGIAAGGAGAALLLTVVCLLMLCVYRCARQGSHESKCLCVGREGGADFHLLCAEYSHAQTSPSWRGKGVWLRYDIPPDPRGA